MEPEFELTNSLEELLQGLQAEGDEQGSGGFRLDPRRALQLLSQQGRLGENAPLFLLRAIYEQTQGAAVQWKLSFFLKQQLCYQPNYGEIPKSSISRILAEGAFQALSVKLVFQPGSVTLYNADRLAAASSSQFGGVFEAARDRLRHYPLVGLFPPVETSACWLTWRDANSRLEVRRNESAQPALEWVVSGVSFFESSPLPVDIVVFDDELKVDLSLTTVPDSAGKREWLSRATSLFERTLKERLGTSKVYLDRDDHSMEQIGPALDYLPYILGLPEENELRRNYLELVYFRDVFQQYWSLEELLLREQSDQVLLVVPSVPKDSPKGLKGSRPVLLWDGETRRFGNPVFKRLQSGAGYLYSLKRGEEVQAKRGKVGEELLCSVQWSDGGLGLKPYGPHESACEVELSGQRRNSETIYLEPPAPKGLRLLWESEDEVASWNLDPSFQDRLKTRVVELVDQSLNKCDRSPEWLLALLHWAEGVSDLSLFPELSRTPVFAGVDDRWFSFHQLSELEGIPVLGDRSASIPEELPYPIVLWDDPILIRLGLATSDVATEVRTRYFKEQGRKRWLSRHQPCPVLEWSLVEGKEHSELAGGHLVFAIEGASRVVICREERPLGAAWILEDAKPGKLLIYSDDQFPADPYWSGPDRHALVQSRDHFLNLLLQES